MAWIYGVIAFVVLFLLFFRRGSHGFDAALSSAVEAKDTTPFEQYLQGVAEKHHAAMYLRAIELLWGRWERALAAKLVRDLVVRFPEEKLGQFWLQKVIEVEPSLAEEELGKEFLTTRYKPEVAAACGAVG